MLSKTLNTSAIQRTAPVPIWSGDLSITLKTRVKRLSGVAVLVHIKSNEKFTQRAELAIALQNDVDFLGVTVTVEVEIRLKSRVLITLHDLRHGVVFQQSAAHGAALSHLRRRPSCEITDEAGIIEIDLRRLNGALENVVGIRVQQKDDPQRFEDVDPCLGGLDVNVSVLC